MLKKFLLLPVLAISLMMGQFAFAHGHCKEKMHEMMQNLQLNADQQAKITAIKSQAMENMKTNWAKMKTIRGEMRTLVTSDKVDEAKLNDLISQKTAVIATMTKNKVMTKNEIYNLLTPEQKQKFKDMMNKEHTGC